MRASFIKTREGWAFATLLAVGVFAIGLSASADSDVWWHLAAGREMVHTHALLYADPFSVSAEGRPWVDVHWLFQIAIYGVYAVGGLLGLVLVKCFLLAAGALVGFATWERHEATRPRLFFVLMIRDSMPPRSSWFFIFSRNSFKNGFVLA